MTTFRDLIIEVMQVNEFFARPALAGPKNFIGEERNGG
jgi:hypothetical protein